MNKQNIVLIGFRSTGKTTFGRAMAKVLNLPFADLDEQIEFYLGGTITDHVKKHGWQNFREVEQRITHDFCRNFSGIIATGAGTIENSKNLQNLTKTGNFVFLNPNFLDVRKILMKDKTRPRLNPDITIVQEIDQMWNQRKPMYQACANYEVQPNLNGNIIEEAEKIIAQLPKTIFPKIPETKKIAILSSSKGTTLQGLLDAQKNGRIPNVEFTVFITDKKDCEALKKAKKAGIKNIEVMEIKKDISREDYDREMANVLREHQPDLILLCGWMRILSPLYCNQFGEKTINVHPSLLPKFAGLINKEIYEKVLDYEEKYTGCTFHKVSDKVDSGEIILQRKVLVESFDDIPSLKAKVQKQEVLGFCKILEKI
ncbi:phosphoribosylglycinamide formyltransferase [Candidatus Gracilibacteria bacterium]|nr:phosphoribosylglycinamide formyltransferase [Candidatus Gracilibacteria bacterium]